jgi:hypothetical protein
MVQSSGSPSQKAGGAKHRSSIQRRSHGDKLTKISTAVTIVSILVSIVIYILATDHVSMATLI